jgi:hypothetical protein
MSDIEIVRELSHSNQGLMPLGGDRSKKRELRRIGQQYSRDARIWRSGPTQLQTHGSLARHPR